MSKRTLVSVSVAVAMLSGACSAEPGNSRGTVEASPGESAGVAGGAADDGAGGGSTPTFASALPDQSPVSALAGAEWGTLCSEIGTWTEDVLAVAPESTCLLGGLVLGGNPQGCETMVDSCLQTAGTPAAPTCDASLQAGCAATIGEIESCLNQVGAVIGSLATGPEVSCATTLDRTMLGAVLRPLTGAPSCLSLQTTCPALSAAVMPGASGG